MNIIPKIKGIIAVTFRKVLSDWRRLLLKIIRLIPIIKDILFRNTPNTLLYVLFSLLLYTILSGHSDSN